MGHHSDRSQGGADAIPDFLTARRHVVTELLRLTTHLRRDGVAVPADGGLEAARALAVVGLTERDRVEAALRATLLTESGDLEAFEAAFPPFWARLRGGLEGVATDDGDADVDSTRPESTLEGDEPETWLENDDGSDEADVRLATGRRHATGERPAGHGGDDARHYSAVGGGERVDAEHEPLASGPLGAVDRLAAALASLRGRRDHPAVAGSRVDARRALRASLETGGTPISLPTRDPVSSELRCCVLLDVSGSVLDTIDRSFLLAFATRLSEVARTARVFLFDTELVEATDAFATARGDPATALRAAEIEWGGGTQIGTALETLRRRYPDAADRRTVVVVVSDGLDVGDDELLESGITWLANRSRAIVWLNPLAVSPRYEPRSRGMATCLPYVDALFGFAEPADVAEAARQLERRGVGGPVGYEYDPRRLAAASGSEAESG
ncbi:vWA domain-containing protein [Natronobeatus ordinarius]|uniref:vWA domain-containing protein n=1 Tax=Natronobeatus ordinarius TaxID=2963433 RepID=UPI0020CD875D|nr:VWA domain-containing protein [Natronobeatus ordinarius]